MSGPNSFDHVVQPSCGDTVPAALVTTCAALCGLCGASVPLVPWTLRICHDHGSLAALAISVVASILIAGVSAAFDGTGCRVCDVVWQTTAAILATLGGVALALGFAYVRDRA